MGKSITGNKILDKALREVSKSASGSKNTSSKRKNTKTTGAYSKKGTTSAKSHFKKGAASAKSSSKTSVAGKTAAPQIIEYFYMNNRTIASSELRDVISSYGKYSVEYWQDADILEIETDTEHSIDIEYIEPEFADKESNDFLKAHNICTLYAFSFLSDIEKEVIMLMKHIASATGGFFAADTPDFMPQIKA